MVTHPKLIGMTIPGGLAALSATRPLGWDIPPREPAGRAERREMTVSPVPNAAGRIRLHDPACFPSASPTSTLWPGKQKTAPKDRFQLLDSLEKIWSGRRDSNPRPQPWQGCALPLSYARFARAFLAAPLAQRKTHTVDRLLRQGAQAKGSAAARRPEPRTDAPRPQRRPARGSRAGRSWHRYPRSEGLHEDRRQGRLCRAIPDGTAVRHPARRRAERT